MVSADVTKIPPNVSIHRFVVASFIVAIRFIAVTLKRSEWSYGRCCDLQVHAVRAVHVASNGVDLVPTVSKAGRFKYDAHMSLLSSRTLIATSLVHIRDVQCRACRGRHLGAAECDLTSHVVVPYRGSFVRRIGANVVDADASQALFFNAGEEYRIDHLTDDGDACLSVRLTDPMLAEVGGASLVPINGALGFRKSSRQLAPALQLDLAWLRWGGIDPLRAEEITLRIYRALLIPDDTKTRHSAAEHRLTRRAKQVLHANPSCRWSLAQIADELNSSPVHLTQSFSKVTGVPLYRYQTKLRLALALHSLATTQDLAALALDLGFSSHSQFTAAFKRMYGLAPSGYRARLRRASSLKNRTATADRPV